MCISFLLLIIEHYQKNSKYFLINDSYKVYFSFGNS